MPLRHSRGAEIEQVSLIDVSDDIEAVSDLQHRSRNYNFEPLSRAQLAKKLSLVALEICIVYLFVNAFDYTFHNPWCNFIFKCGCTWNWKGGWDKCNVHNATGPKCPWCLFGMTNPWSAFLLDTTWYSLFGVVLFRTWSRDLWRTKGWSKLTRCAASMFVGGPLGFVIIGLISALISKIITSYPYFLLPP